MYLLIDNYDSFTYNLYHYLGELGASVQVIRNDAIDIAGIRALSPEGIILSPGPATPNDAGICLSVVDELGDSLPILGVCLGHQSIGQVFGGKVIRAPYVMHGKTSEINHDGIGVFADIPSPFTATRYHSLIVDRDSLPESLEVTAETEDGLIMGLQHKLHPLYGVQFHPESIASDYGHKLIGNFLHICAKWHKK